MSKEKDLLEVNGEIVEVLPNQMFRVRIEQFQHNIVCYTGGRMRKNQIRLTLGDKVLVEMTPYDLTKGRIIYRHWSIFAWHTLCN